MDDRPSSSVPRPAVLALHGLGGGPYEFGALLDLLRERGWTVAAPVLPGHGGPGPVMPRSAWPDWAAAVDTAYNALAASHPRVAVIGFSTGATLALHLADRRPVDRLVLLAPFLAIRYSRLLPWRPQTYLRALSQVLPDLPRRPPAVRDRFARRYVVSAAAFRTFSLHATLSALELIDTVLPRIPAIQTPTLILQGRRDTVVEPARAAWLAANLGSARRDLVWFGRSDHLLALDREREEVIAAALAFLEEPAERMAHPLTGPPPPPR